MKIQKHTRTAKRQLRKIKTKYLIRGTKDRPRISVFISNTRIYVQVIDDVERHTLMSLIGSGKTKKDAQNLGKSIVEKLVKIKIKKAVFDRAGFSYHGRVQTLVDTIREGGVQI